MIVDVRFIAGESIQTAVAKALKFADKNECFVAFEFNGIHMLVKRMSNNFDNDVSLFVDEFYRMLDDRIQSHRERLENEEF